MAESYAALSAAPSAADLLALHNLAAKEAAATAGLHYVGMDIREAAQVAKAASEPAKAVEMDPALSAGLMQAAATVVSSPGAMRWGGPIQLLAAW